MNTYNAPLSFRTSKKVKKQLNNYAKAACLNISQFLTMKIKQKYKYIKKLENFNKSYETIYDIQDILSHIILDRNNQPYNEFYNDDILKPFYTVKYLADNADFIFPGYKPKYDGSKTEHISLRLDSGTNKKLDYIVRFYNCKKSSVIPLLLDNKHTVADTVLPKCFCCLTDIRNYFYKEHIDVPDFEKEYNLLWKTLL